MIRAKRSQAGFTLVELMIVVALIGVLSAIAIPSFLSYQARSRRAESYSNLASMAVLQKSRAATQGDFFDSGNAFPDDLPYGGLGAGVMNWDTASQNAYSELGWEPDGDVRYSYQANTSTDCTCALCFTLTAYGDVDSDGAVSAVMYVEPQRNSSGSVTGACNSGLPGALSFGPPTRLNSGASVYSEVAIQRSTDEY